MPPPLPLGQVRSIARQHRYSEIGVNEMSRVISFMRADTRVNVYYTTRTVGTCVDHPRQGKTQLFRREVNLQMLNAIFADPRLHTDRGYQQKGVSANGRKRGRSASPLPSRRVGTARVVGGVGGGGGGGRGGFGGGGGRGVGGGVRWQGQGGGGGHVGAEEAEARAYLAELRGRRVRHAALQEEIDSLQAFVDVYDQVRTANSAATGGRAAAREREAAAERARQAERAREAAKEEAERERVRAARGMFGRAILGPRARKLVSEMFGKECICMALSGDSDDVLVAHEKGTMGFTPGIPRAVSDLLGGLHDHHPRPTFVTFGSQGRYYIQFENGKSEWLGPDGLSESLKENYSRSVASVAFGRGWNSYFVVYADGYWSCSDLPRELAGVIASRGNTDDLKHVNLGPNGEYFLEAHDGSMFWGGCAEEVMGEAESVRGRVVEILFGSNSTCMVRYS